MPRPRTYTNAGRTQTLSQWAAEIGITYEALRQRITHGWPLEQALATPPVPQTQRKGAPLTLGPLPCALSHEDRQLVSQLKGERGKLDAQIERLRAQREAVTDHALAAKFECSLTTIRRA